ncbi:conserved hypothetical protein [Uncinocarpus reesii 1704]|uniref:Amino acid permease/ SLC12A domain-containing protein n=1 Tax=Uncinocarpus reesii (strain UAMH 1704) TaxID=336963 RepID=C4JY40_UNCRE|nr:uncharacterized protein UREG_07091 [Uncinocarpus reesii 1704]EEP82226.1 conserved hypothetical protein [Uncinocarpus reesii 1704]
MATPLYSAPAKGSESIIRLTAIGPDRAAESEQSQHAQEPEDEQFDSRRRKESLWRDLGETRINARLFLGSGATLALAGPFGGVLAYLLVGTVISSVVSCLGEMTALMPVNAPVMEFPRRFLDRGVGFAVGWMYWYALAFFFFSEVNCSLRASTRFTFVVIAAHNLVTAARTAKLHYDDGKTSLAWGSGEDVDVHIWFAVFLLVVILINLFPVKWTASPRKLISRYDWDSPYESVKSVFQVKGSDGNVQRQIIGSTGKLLGMW